MRTHLFILIYVFILGMIKTFGTKVMHAFLSYFPFLIGVYKMWTLLMWLGFKHLNLVVSPTLVMSVFLLVFFSFDNRVLICVYKLLWTPFDILGYGANVGMVIIYITNVQSTSLWAFISVCDHLFLLIGP